MDVRLEAHRGTRRPERLTLDSDVVERELGRGPHRIERSLADSWRVNRPASEPVPGETEPLGDADVGTERVKELIRQIVFDVLCGVSGENTGAVPLIAK